ncbi:hypothetical protein EPA93_23900 [Ktedonosporobacter rubrisoli]|uniref:ABC transporter permease n=1 Tax=Ktedonosporobacter rubrisoli TaxID=2509675 RepID=A0A4P6JTF3_KTERU|nr:hypothetical protein [Ktedonosporobacter rubrisoli]QBD78859.1 hypothetical protein EPA93_23900 [Ktedonosporobacter rubrisoli]
MRQLWMIVRLELILFWRGKVSWFIMAFILAWGFIFVFAAAHHEIDTLWIWVSVYSHILTLALVFTTGNQIQRDRECQLEGVVLSTPVSTVLYVCGKWLAGLIILLGFAVCYLLFIVGLDLVLPARPYFSPGALPYVLSWLWLIPVPLAFGTALSLWSMVQTGGKRPINSIILLVFWLTSFFNLPDLINLMGGLAKDPASIWTRANVPHGTIPSGAQVQYIVELVKKTIPYVHITPIFELNRLLFLGLSVLLLILTILLMHRQRQELA